MAQGSRPAVKTKLYTFLLSYGRLGTAEENAAFVRFLEEYEKEQDNAKRTHAAIGQWLEKKSKVTD